MIDTFFKDLKVLELAAVLAGPAVGQFFAELGAEVIKIENKKTGGDVTRNWRLPGESSTVAYSAYYCSVNWHKQTFFLDLRDEKDREKVYELAKTTDVIISNFKASSARKIGMDYAVFSALNPRLIYAQLYAFGADSDRPAFDIVLQAEAGFLYMNGEKERDPVRMPVALIDLLAAHQLKEAILLALLHRKETGRGSFVSTSLLESALSSLANQATNWLMAGHIPQRMGTEHPNIAPYGDVFYTKDEKPLVLAVGTEKQFAELCKVLNTSKMLEDKRFSTNAERVKNRKMLKTLLTESVRKFERATLMELLEAQKVPAGSIRDMQEVFEQKKAAEMILTEEMPDGETSKRMKTVAFTIRAE